MTETDLISFREGLRDPRNFVSRMVRQPRAYMRAFLRYPRQALFGVSQIAVPQREGAERSGRDLGLWPWQPPTQLVPAKMPSGKPWPRISIVTPSYQQGEFIEQTIRSVLMQGYPNLEYIVVDGGSTDCTQAVLRRYASELHACISEADGGQAFPSNKGFQTAP